MMGFFQNMLPIFPKIVGCDRCIVRLVKKVRNQSRRRRRCINASSLVASFTRNPAMSFFKKDGRKWKDVHASTSFVLLSAIVKMMIVFLAEKRTKEADA